MTPENTPHVDCVTFGSPCQDLSIAGKREGLAGSRSGLFMDAVRIIKNMQLQSFGAHPKFAVWENVPGAFSSNKGEDFRAVLEELARIKEPEVSIPRPEGGKWAKAGFISGNGWSVAWRTLDAQFWGVPQRRHRIALVMDLGGQRAGEILFESEGVSGYLEPSIPPWKGIARNPANRTAGYDQLVEGEAECLTPWDVQSRRVYMDFGKSPALYAGEGGGHGYVCLNDQGGGRMDVTEDVAATLRAENHGHPPCVMVAGHERAVLCAAFTAGQGAKACGIGYAEEQAPTLRTNGGLSAMPTVLCRAHGQANAETLENCNPTLNCNHEQPIVFESHSQDARYTQQGDTAPACTAQWGTGGNNMPLILEKYSPDIAHALRAKANCSFREDSETFVAERKNKWVVRRLTPTERERLQGFPDGWTDIGEWIDGKGKRRKPADSPRYKALGNSIALPQWWWLTCKMARYLPEHATLGSLFDGIGGFPLVWETYHGKNTAVWASEIEEFPIAVTKLRFKE